MDNLTNSMLQIDYEIIRREGGAKAPFDPSVFMKPILLDRMMTALGEALIHLGSRLKERAYQRSTVERAAEPTFMIML